MTYSEETLWCDGCGIEIRWSPFVFIEQTYCCQECSLGLSCKCIKTIELEDEYRNEGSSLPASYFGS